MVNFIVSDSDRRCGPGIGNRCQTLPIVSPTFKFRLGFVSESDSHWHNSLRLLLLPPLAADMLWAPQTCHHPHGHTVPYLVAWNFGPDLVPRLCVPLDWQVSNHRKYRFFTMNTLKLSLLVSPAFKFRFRLALL